MPANMPWRLWTRFRLRRGTCWWFRAATSHVEDLDTDEWAEVFTLVREICRELSERDGVDGVNVGINSVVAAGQTVDHAHVHVIPRRLGDVPDPRGGVRHVIPGRADYWNNG